MAWVFIDMMTADDASSATVSAARIADPRLVAFHDPKHRLGRAMARVLGWQGQVAWDTYFVYRAGTLWRAGAMPPPDEWFHQLKDREVWEQTAKADVGTADWTHALPETSEADPVRFHTGTDLRRVLELSLKAHAGDSAVAGESPKVKSRKQFTSADDREDFAVGRKGFRSGCQPAPVIGHNAE